MNILQVNKYFHPSAGVESYLFFLNKLLIKKGHKLAFFAMKDESDQNSKWQKYFIDNVSFNNRRLIGKVRFVSRLFYSSQAKQKLNLLLQEFKPDVVHLHSLYHQLSPSIIPLLKNKGIPIVQHLHDYHLISPNYSLFHRNRICEITKPDKFYKAIFHRCVKNSYLASSVEVAEKYLHRFFDWELKLIDYFIVPSLFMKNKLIEFGITPDKLKFIPHFIDYQKYKPHYRPGEYILYFGRLAEEKGVLFLLEVMKRIPHLKLIIAGIGPLESKLKSEIDKKSIKNIQLIGFKKGAALNNLIRNCKFTVLPSLWYEVFGMSSLESFASGKPVAASKIGAVPEIVQSGFNGFLFEPGNMDDAVKKIKRLAADDSLIIKMGNSARRSVINNFNGAKHYQSLMKLYDQAVNL